jgi:CRP-like cAMP-binding protein
VRPPKSANKRRAFDARKFLSTIGDGRRAVAFTRKQKIFAQGDAADSVFYIQKGKVRLTVVSERGKEATVGVLNSGDFRAA